jgi:NADH dehydrogenase [ubiquinone] 1 alpha subcomplex assembly factor 7
MKYSKSFQVAVQLPAIRSVVESVHLVETSRPLRSAQEALLAPLAAQLDCQLHWHDMVEDVSEDAEVFTIVVAHEFFDALPFRVVQASWSLSQGSMIII